VALAFFQLSNWVGFCRLTRLHLATAYRSSLREQKYAALRVSSNESGIRVRVVLPATTLPGDHPADSIPRNQHLGHEDTVDGYQ
jgi:hypothetical protein